MDAIPTQLTDLPEESFAGDRPRPWLMTTMWPREAPYSKVLEAQNTDVLFSPSPREVLAILGHMDEAGRRGLINSGPPLRASFQDLSLSPPKTLNFEEGWQNEPGAGLTDEVLSFGQLMDARRACEDREFMISLDPALVSSALADSPSSASLGDWQASCHYNCFQIAAQDREGRSWLSTGNYFRQNLLSYLLYSVETPSAGEQVLREVSDHEPWEAAWVLSEGLAPEFGSSPSREVASLATSKLLRRLLGSDHQETRRLAFKASRLHQQERSRPDRL